MKERKKELRKQIAFLKTKYDFSTLTEWSADILQLLENHPLFQQAGTVLLYHSLPDEVQTHDFVNRWTQEKRMILPVVVGNELELRIYTGPQDMEVGSYGIAEPVGKEFTDYAAIDLAVIPGVAFDNSGRRLGRGKGYYDRLLPKLQAPKLGICLPFQLVSEVPSESFDIRMDGLITLSEMG